MNAHFKGLLFSALLFCVFILAFYSRADDTPATRRLEALLAKRLPAHGTGVVVLIARDGKLLFSQSYGFADRENQVPASPETQFRIGSVSKQFTAAAILRLAGENRLSIKDTLAKYFPKYPSGDKITLYELLTHTSGLHNYTAHPDFMAKVTQPISPTELVAWFQDDPPDFAPGEQFRYSNTGYILLGQIVEKVSGMSLSEYLNQQFFIPLNMHDTGLYLNAVPPPHAAKGYSFRDKMINPAVDWDMSWAAGAGGLYSTVGDLWRWTEALHDGRVLSPQELQMMLTEGTATKKETLIRYGMGLCHSEIGWLPVIGHNGGVDGFGSAVTWFPETKVTIVVLENAQPTPPDIDPHEILVLAAHAFLGPEMTAHAPKINLPINPKIYSDYVGCYSYGGTILEISVESSRVFAQFAGQNKCEIFPSGPDAFFWNDGEARVIFDRDTTGAVIAFTRTQDGETSSSPKLSEKSLPVISVEALDAIVGQYQLNPKTVLTISRRNNQLYAQVTDQPEFPIFPKSDHEFFSIANENLRNSAAANAKFYRGDGGKITGATIRIQNGGTVSAPKLDAK
jgi:CubicO group peptidase (beta-lactamase class C family)